MTVSHEIPMVVSSATTNGAVNKSADGSQFEINLEDDLKIPDNAKNVSVAVEEAEIWWTIPNIITGTNDKFYVNGRDTADVVQNYTVTIPQGLYTHSELNSTILADLESQGAKQSPNPIIQILAHTASNKIQIRLEYNDSQVDFTQAQTPRDILGYNSQLLTTASAPENILAPNVAAFNTVNYFLIHTDLLSQGMRFNNVYNQTVAKVPITVQPGSQIVFQPVNPPRIHEPFLKGVSRNRIKFWLTGEYEFRGLGNAIGNSI